LNERERGQIIYHGLQSMPSASSDSYVFNIEHGANVKQTHPKLDKQNSHDDFLHQLHQMVACEQCVSIQLQNWCVCHFEKVSF